MSRIRILAAMMAFNFAAVLLMLGACSTTTATTPAQSIYALKQAYLASLTLAFTYANLPPCPVSAPICSDANVVHNLQTAANVADAAIKSAETTVTDPAFTGGTLPAQILVTATNAVTAFANITATLKVK
jgi:hypothetical protein